MRLIVCFCLLFLIGGNLNAQTGGATPALALANPTFLPTYEASHTTKGQGDNVNNPAGFANVNTTGPDFFFYFTAPNNGSVTLTIDDIEDTTTTVLGVTKTYKRLFVGVKPSVSVWDGVPGAGGTLVASKILPGNSIAGQLKLSFNSIQAKAYYIMIDNYALPNGFDFNFSIYDSPIQNACTNIGFETTDLTGWTYTTGGVTDGISNAPYPNFSNSAYSKGLQHLVMTSGNDPITGLPMVCPGLGSASLRLGDGGKITKKSLADGATIEQQFSVTPSNSLLIYYYSVVLQDPGHTANQQPMFKIDMMQCDGTPIPCGEYLVVASGSIPGFVSAPPPAGFTDPVLYKDWTPVFLDLSPYIGSCVTLRFTTMDCSEKGHFGYAYIDAVCKKMEITKSSVLCAGSSVKLSAPSGAASYSWTIVGDPTVLGTDSTITVSPSAKTKYECLITSLVGCPTTLDIELDPLPLPSISGSLAVCEGVTQQFTSSNPDLTTPWVSSDISVGTIDNTGLFTAIQAGTTDITFKDNNGCTKTETLTIKNAGTITGNFTVCNGGTLALANTENPDPITPWSTSDITVATIDNAGLLQALLPGSVTVTFTNDIGCTTTQAITIKSSPVINDLADTSVCDTYTLPTITGLNLTGSQNYYTNSQSNSGVVLNNLTLTNVGTQTIWMYDSNGTCSTEQSVVITLNKQPKLDTLLDTTLCDSYALPALNGLDVSGTQGYYSNFQSLGGVSVAGPITSSQRIWYYDANGSCIFEDSFQVTINNTPSLTNPGNQTVCGNYLLPTPIQGANLSASVNYYSDAQANGGSIITGQVTSTQTVWIYDANGSCSDEVSFDVTIKPAPQITNPGNQSICTSYSLPAIQGTGLTGNEKYYDNSQAANGVVINGPITSSQTIYIFDDNGTCSDEVNFDVTILGSISLDTLRDTIVCDSFTLLPLTGSNLSGDEAYYDDSQANGGQLLVGPITSSQRVWAYGTNANCSSERSFMVTVNKTPSITNPGNVTVCDSFPLPVILGSNLSGNEAYYSDSQLNNGLVLLDTIQSNQTLWIYDNQGSCSDEVSFTVTINKSPKITKPSSLVSCDSLLLPVISGTDLVGDEAYYTDKQANAPNTVSGYVKTSQVIWIYSTNVNCPYEDSFQVLINYTPSITNPGNVTVCDSFSLGNIMGVQLTGNQAFYSDLQANNPTLISGPITSTQTVYVYDSDGACSDEESFTITVNKTPKFINPGTIALCDSVVLPSITGVNLSGNQNYYDTNHLSNPSVVNYTLTSSQTIWIYDSINGCSFEDSFNVFINPKPIISFSVDNVSGCVPVVATFSSNTLNVGDSLVWDFGDGTKQTVFSDTVFKHTYTQTGCFDVSLTTEKSGCSQVEEKKQFICSNKYAVANFEFDPNPGFYINPLIQLINKSSEDVTSYTWTFDDGTNSTATNPTHQFLGSPGTYSVLLTVNNAANCPNSIRRFIELKDEFIYYVPNSFTPDGDQINNVFKPIFASGYDPQSYTLYIFNRWGEIVFESHNVDYGWDGTYGDRPAEIGTYTWKIKIKNSVSNQIVNLKGHLNLIR